MNRIILNTLRRWWWFYLLGFLGATVADVAAALFEVGHSSFPATTARAFAGAVATGLVGGLWAPYLLAPILGPMFVLAFDLYRGAAGITIALPISIKKIELSYWLIGVCIPPVVLSVALVLATIIGHQFDPSVVLGWEKLSLNFLISLFLAGSVFVLLTFLPGAPPEGIWSQITSTLAAGFWGASVSSGFFLKQLFQSKQGGPATIASVLSLGLVLTVLGHSRAVKLVITRARTRAGGTRPGRESAEVKAGFHLGGSGLRYLFFASIQKSLAFPLLILPIEMIFGQLGEHSPYPEFVLFMCGILPSMAYSRSLRQMRVLPFSIDKLALTLFLLPLGNLVAATALLGLLQAMGLLGVFYGDPARSLILIAGIVCIGHTLTLRFGQKVVPLIFGFGLWFVAACSELLKAFPPSCSWIGGAILMGASFGLLRRWLQSSGMYRNRGGGYAGV